MDSTEFFACLALRHTPGIGPKTWAAILTRYCSAYEALQDAGSWPVLGCASQRISRECRAESWRQQAEEEYRRAMACGMQVITYLDSRYPRRLRQIPDPPILLYYLGDDSLLQNPGLAVVGARKCTTQGLNATRTMAEDLSRAGLTVISGMAYGIDRQAHLGGLAAVGSSIAVLGTGIDVIYPRENADIYKRLAQGGLLLSEYAPGSTAAPGNFPRRNRIISGLSHAVVVSEAAKRSGSLITARLALEQGRDVYALPGHAGVPSHEGSNGLIKQGARLVDSADDILEDLMFLLSDHTEEASTEGRDHADRSAAADGGAAAGGTPPVKPEKNRGERAVDDGQNGTATAAMQEPADAEDAQQTPEEEPLHERVGAARPAADRRKRLSTLGGTEGRVARLLRQRGRMHVDQVGRELELGASEVGKTLVLLEIKGLVRQLPGMYYTLA